MAEHRVEAVERALSIIECFTGENRELTLTEISELTGLYMSTILRLCGSLERYGYIVRRPSGQFRIGPSLWRLGVLYSSAFENQEDIRPSLRAIVAATKETASFYVQEGNDRVCLFREISPHALRFELEEGARLPMERGAAAHVLRAFSGEKRPEDQNIRQAGYAISDGERTPGVAAVAVPVFDANGALRGALGISGPSFRLTREAQQQAVGVLKLASKTLATG